MENLSSNNVSYLIYKPLRFSTIFLLMLSMLLSHKVRSTVISVHKEKIKDKLLCEEKINIANSLIVIQSEITGVIRDEAGNLLPGANVLVSGTSNGVVTNFDGRFSIQANVGDTLIISYLGMETLEVTISDTQPLNLTLQTDAAALDEVVVVGYGTQKKKDLTGAIATVKPEDFAPGTNTNAAQLLTGSAAGVNVSQISSAPGGAIKIQIRGAGSINSSNSVLFVVDGIPGIDPSSLSPDDIESIEVLKDASAAAIYGTRAANGVVLITTKRGKSGKTTLSYSSYTGIQSVSKQLDVLGGSDYRRLINLRSANPVFSEEEILEAGEGTNWQDEIFRNATIQNHQISASGGSEKGNHYIGLNYFDQDGVVKRSSSQRYNLRMNITTKPIERLSIAVNMNYNRILNKSIRFSNAANNFAGPINTAIQFDPTLPAGLDENGRYFLNPTIALDNPVALINGIDTQGLSNRFYASLSADYEVFNNLTATLRMGAESNNGRSDIYRSRITELGLANGGEGFVFTNEYTHWVTDYLLTYEKTFSDKHDFSVLAGATYEVFLSRNLNANSAGFLSDVTGVNLLQSGDGELRDNVGSGKAKNQLNGFLGRMTYGYDNRYLLTASFRRDGSSRFSDVNKYANFFSGSIGWRVNEEPFLKDVTWMNELKVRVGYGELGNQGIQNFETRQTLIAGGNSVFGGAIFQGAVLARLPNPDLRWETTAEVNAGLDFGFLNDRISGTVDYFNRKTTDQLFFKPLPSVVGFTAVRTNLGEVQNKGWDVLLKTKNLIGDFKWNTTLTMSFLKNEVTELPDFTQEIIGGNIGTFISNFVIVREGAPLRSFYGYEIDGIFQEGDDIENSPTPNVSGYAPGMPRFVDQNNDGEITDEDRVILGDPFPDVNYGISNSFQYKNVSLDVYIVGVSGIETLDANILESLYPTNSARNSISRYFLDRWTPENPSNTLPSGITPSLYGGGLSINSLTVRDASFVRLRTVSLGYNLPLPSKKALKSLKVFVAADNLLTITDFEGYDPDASSAGNNNNINPDAVTRVSYNSYPLARTLRLGLEVKF